MKIVDVTLTLFAWEGIPATQYVQGVGGFGGTSQLGLLRLVTDEGLEGHALLGSSSRGAQMDAPMLMAFLKPVVMGQDPLDRERLFQAMWKRNRNVTLRAIGAVDVALWDLAGKIAGLPVYRLLGAYRDSVPAYASSALLPSREAYVEEALAIKEKGWAGYKIHPPTRWREDVAICRAVREAVGDQYTLMLDSTWAYDYPTALRVGRAIAEMGYHWYEDPLAEDDIFGCQKLRQKLAIPLMATEYAWGGQQAAAPWAVLQATDYLRGDVAVKGGITSLVKTAHLAEGFHMNYEVHHGGNSLNNVANLHVICALRNSEFFEVILPDAAQKYGLLQDLEVGSDGLVHVPQGPGLGAAIDFDLIAKKTLAVLR